MKRLGLTFIFGLMLFVSTTISFANDITVTPISVDNIDEWISVHNLMVQTKITNRSLEDFYKDHAPTGRRWGYVVRSQGRIVAAVLGNDSVGGTSTLNSRTPEQIKAMIDEAPELASVLIPKRDVTISKLAVSPLVQRNGLGRFLVDYCGAEGCARAKQAYGADPDVTIKLDWTKESEPFYRKLGFQESNGRSFLQVPRGAQPGWLKKK